MKNIHLINFYFKFSDVIEDLYNAVNPRTDKWSPLVSDELRDFVKANSDVIIQ